MAINDGLSGSIPSVNWTRRREKYAENAHGILKSQTSSSLPRVRIRFIIIVIEGTYIAGVFIQEGQGRTVAEMESLTKYDTNT